MERERQQAEDGSVPAEKRDPTLKEFSTVLVFDEGEALLGHGGVIG